MSIFRQSPRLLRNVAILAVGAAVAFKFYDKEFFGVWAHLKTPWLLCAAGAAFIAICLRLAKWHLLLVEERIPRGAGESARSMLGAYALGSVTPGRFGDFGRFLFMSDGQRARTLLYTLVDKLFDVSGVLTLAVASLYLFAPWEVAVAATVAWAGAIPLAIWGRRLASASDRAPVRLRRLAEIWKVVSRVNAGRFTAWSVAACTAEMTALFFLLQAFHGAELRTAFATYPWLVIAGSLPISLGGVGPREGLAAVLLPLFSFPAAAAVSVSLVYFALTVLAPSVFGGVWVAIDPPALDGSWRRTVSNLWTPRESGSAPICS